MALGDANNRSRNSSGNNRRSGNSSYSNNNSNYSNSNNSKVPDQSYYSRVRIKNNEGLSISFSYGKGLLRIEVDEEQENYRYEPVININISITKAKILIPILEDFINRMKSGEIIDPNNAVGIDTGTGDITTYIAFRVTGKKPEIPEHSFVIWKNNANGDTLDSLEFVFNTDYNYSLKWADLQNQECDKFYDQFVGIQTILDTLKEFAYTGAGALGASVWDIGRYDMNRITKSFDAIYDKLGIERKVYGQSGSSRTNNDNFFKRSSNSEGNDSFNGMNPPQSGGRSSRKSFDEIEEMIG